MVVDSDPAGIQMSVQTPGQALWIVTQETVDVDSGDDVYITAPNVAGEPLETPGRCWVFDKWEDDTTDRKRHIAAPAAGPYTATYRQQLYFPTRTPTRRASKFEGKTASDSGADALAARTTALKPLMVEQQAISVTSQVTMENKVGEYLMSLGLFGTDMHHYRNFSQELWGLTRLFKGPTLNAEGQLKANKWYHRLGSTPTVATRLIAVASLLGVTITTPS